MSNNRYYIIYNISNTFIVYICVICLIYLSVNDIVLAYNVCKNGFTNELGLEVIIKRASDLISPYVGETEQNIAEAFSEAKSKKAMLIFDEADTFLQNRNNATRKWEISQVNEMLTWMEVHEYPFIYTTNNA